MAGWAGVRVRTKAAGFIIRNMYRNTTISLHFISCEGCKFPKYWSLDVLVVGVAVIKTIKTIGNMLYKGHCAFTGWIFTRKKQKANNKIGHRNPQSLTLAVSHLFILTSSRYFKLSLRLQPAEQLARVQNCPRKLQPWEQTTIERPIHDDGPASSTTPPTI